MIAAAVPIGSRAILQSMDREELIASGERIALTILVGQALALSVRDREDPRSELREVLLELEQSLARAVSALSDALGEGQMEVLSDAGQRVILDTARIADSFLDGIGAKPAS